MEKKKQIQKIVIITLNIIFALLYSLFIGGVLYLWGMIRLVDGLYFLFLFHFLFAFIILVVLFLIFRYFSQNHGFFTKKTEKKYALILGITLLVISGASVTGIEIKHNDLSTYTREKWLERGYDRGRMIKSFMKKIDLVNKTESDLFYYLGEPTYITPPREGESFAYCYNYNLGFYFDFMDPSTFDVYFNDAKLITHAEITLH